MKKQILLNAIFLFSISCVAQSIPKLEKVWESEPVFTTAESVIYDPVTKVIYVSNIDGQPWDEDGKGSIGKLGTDGKVIVAKWVEGLNCPKGLGISKGKLYVTDINKLIKIDIKSAKIIQKYTVETAEGLNDVTTSPNGTVYFSDSKKGVVYMLKNNKVSVVKDGFGGSNGVYFEPNKLLIGTWADSSLVSYNFSKKTLTKIATKIPQPDGIEAISPNEYLVSTWSGIIHHVDRKGNRTEILNTMTDKIGSADIDFAKQLNLVLVPTFFRNTVVAFRLVK
jgi:sugar lactone lactonase YvrE